MESCGPSIIVTNAKNMQIAKHTENITNCPEIRTFHLMGIFIKYPLKYLIF